MKYLSQYMEERQSAAFKTARAFFAFSNKQFDEAKEEWEKYVNLWGGLICPKSTAKTLIESLDTIYKDCIQEDIKDNWLNAIIRRELNNHEAYYTWDITSTVEKLSDYPVTAEDIRKVFHNQNFIPNPA